MAVRVKVVVFVTPFFLSAVGASQFSAGYGSLPNDRGRNEFWTQWYNTDNPANYGGDDESLQSIRKRGWEVCPGYNIVSAQCRKVGSQMIFSQNSLQRTAGVDTLYLPCSTAGLYCRNHDQPINSACADYEIRFQCKSGAATDEAVYTWVAVLAVVFLVIPIAWVILINAKRKFCPQPERSRDQASANERGTSVSTVSDPSLAEPPPSYEALFGGGSPMSPNSFDFGSTSALLSNDVQRSGTTIGGQPQSPSLRDNLGFSQPNSSSRGQGITPSNSSVTGMISQSNPSIAQVHRTNMHPGVHLPPFPLERQISAGLTTPPPTYDDAIVKLGVPPFKKDSS